jgi:hypothetical protein
MERRANVSAAPGLTSSVIKAPTGNACEIEATSPLIRSSSHTQLRWKSGNWILPFPH